MIQSWRDFRAYVRADMKSNNSTASFRNLVFLPVIRFSVLLRLHELVTNKGLPLPIRLPIKIWFRRLSLRLGFTIEANIFGPGMALVHYGTIVIDPTTRIGKNCRCHVGVNIGGNRPIIDENGEKRQAPQIGDNVYIGPGAKLYGPIVIGDDCVIGANAVVTKSFPESGLTIAGIPARVISRDVDRDLVIKGAT